MQAFWFGVIAVLWAGFFVLEGFDLGVGVLLPIVADNDLERRVAIRSIGPVWDGNEVWLLVAGGATFAAFPAWYAGMFSGFYLAFALLLVGLILRGIGIEYRGKAQTDSGRRWCDAAFVAGSFLPALLLGVAFANLLRGVKMDAQGNMTSSFFSLLSPYALLGGVLTLLLFAYHGAAYLTLRTEGEVHDVADRLAPILGVATAGAAVAFLAWTITIRGGWVSIVLAVLIACTLIASLLFNRRDREGASFAASAVTTLLVPIWAFAALWPDVLPARNNAAWSLTVHNASSTPYTLKVMTVVALIMTPIVLIYQAWSYWVFRARVTGADVEGDAYAGGVGGIVAKARHSASEVLSSSGADRAGEPSGRSPS
jgi:cytochrome bd ubiquinol oxidase subunit II